MVIWNKNLKRVPFNGDFQCAALIFGLAYLAGEYRSIKVLQSANQKGLMAAARGANIGLMGSHLAYPTKHESAASLLHKTVAMAISCSVITTLTVKTYSKEYKILSGDIYKFSGLSVGVKWGQTLLHLKMIERVKPSNPTEAPEPKEAPVPLKELPDNWTNRKGWQVEETVHQFDIDAAVESLSPSYSRSVILQKLNNSLGSGRPCDPNIFNTFKYNISDQANWGRYGDFHWYLDKVLEYLHEQRRRLGDGLGFDATDQNALEARVENLFSFLECPFVKEELQGKDLSSRELCLLIERVVKWVNEAYRNCIDQRLSMMRTIAINVLETSGLGTSSAQMKLSLELEKYRTGLIKEAVVKSGEEEAADLEVKLAQHLQRELGLPSSRLHNKGAKYESSNRRFSKALEHFNREYDPVKFLLENINYHTMRETHAHMCQWFRENVYVGDPDQDKKLEREFGCDFLIDVTNHNKKAVCTYLYSQGIICPKKMTFPF